ncbi:MAG: DinB family protein [Chloroflexi bacterium]|nr:DinB family protein [Chloroflexota bacterium]
MDGRLLRDAFAHHVWATLTVLDTCAELDPIQLEASAPGTFGPIVETLRHLVSADTSYLWLLSGGEVEPMDDATEATADIATLRATMVADGEAWMRVLDRDLDPDLIIVRHRDDGSEGHAALGIRLAQVIHHGTDHRSQVCTALTTLGVTPPEIDVWDYALRHDRMTDVPPPDPAA